LEKFGLILKENRKKKKMSQKILGQTLGLGQTTIANYESGLRFPSHDKLILIANYFGISIDELMGINKKEGVNQRDEPYEDDYKILQSRFQILLLEERENEAIHLIYEKSYEDEALIRLYEEVFEKTLYNIGDKWQSGEVSVAKEHYISNIVLKLISAFSLNRRLREKGMENQPIALCMSYSSEFHTIGLRIVEEYLNILGFETRFVGSDTPTDSLVEMIRITNISLIAISITMDYHLDGVKNLIGALKQYLWDMDVKIIVGGQGIKNKESVKINLGADGYAEDYSSLKALVEKW
jgi:methanogenic corrinoid protein MtbC1